MRKCSWAKKILAEASQNLLLSSSNPGLLEHLIEILPEEAPKNNPPVLLPPLENACYDKNLSVHVAIRGRNHWQALYVFPNPDPCTKRIPVFSKTLFTNSLSSFHFLPISLTLGKK